MKVILNKDEEIVKTIREGLKQRGGYCPCKAPKIEETHCMCQEFRDQLKDSDWYGFCHCGLYQKLRDERS